VSLSPSKQALMALGAVGLAGWCVYATGNVLLQGPSGPASVETERLQAKYDRWLNEARAQASAYQAQLEERSDQFDRLTREFEQRHQVLANLLDYSSGASGSLIARPLERDGARMLTQASIEDADTRESRAVATGVRVQSIGFRAQADQLRADQEMALAELEDRVVARTEQMRGVLRMTGVSMTRLTEGEDAMGGPLVPQDFVAYLSDSGMDTAFARRVEQVAARVEEARRIDAVADSTPLGVPVGVDHRETSGFGPRVDPFTGRPAFHAGLDFAAFERAPVVATSPGIVSFAGVKSGYGNVVEIDHGHGFRTRYAHLRDFQVGRGDRVVIGQRIGSMGSTGRSTGTHLHYEVFFRGRVYDPINFIRAGRYVHEQG
jgi:murein DD-endopeptidase MepM/ murein hydrolase activator NlpD